MAILDDAIERLDTRLFDGVEAQSTDGDRRALLAVQRAVRRSGNYVYLEIGSHMGGSIQQHLVDQRCTWIVSIDNRPRVQADDRGACAVYEGNTTARMLAKLRGVPGGDVDKIICFDAKAEDVDPRQLPARPDFCFIDGEHTHAAVLGDFRWCLEACSPNAAVCFHDGWIVARALQSIVGELRRRGVPFVARKLTGSVFAIFLGECPARNDSSIETHSEDADRWLRRWVLLWRLRECLPHAVERLAVRILRPFSRFGA